VPRLCFLVSFLFSRQVLPSGAEILCFTLGTRQAETYFLCGLENSPRLNIVAPYVSGTLSGFEVPKSHQVH
jgi:hypothetical protein